jgi:hypothetical protein
MNTNTAEVSMTTDQLTGLLAERVMHWRATPDRFLTGGRVWSPRWKFQPTKRLSDAIRLLETAMPQEYSMAVNANGEFWVKVKIARTVAQAQDRSKPLAIFRAVAAASGIEVKL